MNCFLYQYKFSISISIMGDDNVDNTYKPRDKVIMSSRKRVEKSDYPC